jgi:TonB-dependent SusC/RagA subfamily outer membrane receptor
MAATGHRVSWSALLHAGAVALVAAGCAGTAPALAPDGPAPERVEVGYGTQDPRTITGAVASLNVENQSHPRVTRVEELFQGRLPGVQVVQMGGGYSVRIRGATTLMGDGEPLYVIDGVPLSNVMPGRALDGINPADVARIDVLKDAGSAAIYGSKAANGVILITTRRR